MVYIYFSKPLGEILKIKGATTHSDSPLNDGLFSNLGGDDFIIVKCILDDDIVLIR